MKSMQKLKKIALALAIVIVMNIFFNVGIQTFYPMPDYDDFCGSEIEKVEYAEDQEACIANGGTWNIEQDWEYCESWEHDCWSEYEDHIAPYERNAFVALVALGLVSLMIGLFTNLPGAVLNGLLYGGILSTVIGTMRYWSYMEDYFQFIVSGIALVVLIVVGVKKLKD